jgi:hypothetical protein
MSERMTLVRKPMDALEPGDVFVWADDLKEQLPHVVVSLESANAEVYVRDSEATEEVERLRAEVAEWRGVADDLVGGARHTSHACTVRDGICKECSSIARYEAAVAKADGDD